jgi:tetratricopeptide (TPR) repeat protein
MSIFVETQCIASLQNDDEAKYTVVIMPLQNNTPIPTAANSADNLLRSELIKTGYFKVVERDETYETIVEFVPSDDFYIGGYESNDTFTPGRGRGNAERWKVKHKGDIGWLDMPFRLERHTIVKFAEKLDADFAIAGGINQFGERIRFDIELISPRCNRTLASLTGDAEGFEQLPDVVTSLTLDVAKVCRRVNAQRDANNIVSRYKQGLYTYEVTIRSLKELSSMVPDSFAPPVTLLSIYLERPDMEEEIISTGEKILTLFDPQQDEHFEILQTIGIDPFDELAKVYEKRGSMDNVIKTHTKAIKLYPFNTLSHCKKLAIAYQERGLEQQHIETLQKALLVCKTDPDIYYYLGTAMENAGKFEQAIEYYQKGLKYTNDASLTSEMRQKISQIKSTK